MATDYSRAGPAGWVRQVGPVRLHLSDENGAPSPAQAAVAAVVAASLGSLRDKAASYLDLFVDRARACGRADEPWWLDAIEFRDHAGSDPLCYALHFTLEGDADGLWSVDMRVLADAHRPFRFECRQG
ncbi:hypothetical protein ASF49_10560 [Methylobacterium sp. Leaf104]|uniref:hypothetical protein n=1 Tax=Methylobacterium TaxID=407 RepID=UPI0006F8133D|nr:MULTISPECIES: hypothetical protein [Methylobacterium]KQP31859.1 hypothetical protein ASF49_10560 [Methylobacterium sp. Leaf104]MCI9880791.1 hypothetical protein [Methylobacterium goesingense]